MRDLRRLALCILIACTLMVTPAIAAETGGAETKQAEPAKAKTGEPKKKTKKSRKKATLKPAMWDMTMTMTVEGMDPKGHVFKVKMCMEPNSIVTVSKEKDCKVTEKEITGNAVTWKELCADKNGSVIESHGRVTYKGTEIRGMMTLMIKPNDAAPASKVSQAIEGNNIGECN